MSASGASAAPPRIVVLPVRTLEDFDRLADEWDDLLGRCEIDGFFASWTWCRAWIEATAEDFRIFVLVARNAERRVIGIAPLAVARASQRLEFLGQSFWGEYLGFLLDPACEAEAADALCEAIAQTYRSSWSRIHFRFVRADSRFETFALASFERHGITLRETNIEAAPYVSLPSGIREYYASRSSHFAKRIEYIERRLAKEGAVELKIAGETIGAYEAIEIFWQLYESRWESYDRTFANFHREFAVDLVDRGEALIAILYVAGRPVAARYDLVFAGKVWSYLGGWDPAWSRFEVGNVLIGRLLVIAIERGQREYDFLAGDAEYKRRWSNGVRAMVDLVDVATLEQATAVPDEGVALGEIDGLSFVNGDMSNADPTGEMRVGPGCRVIVGGWIAMREPVDGEVTAFASIGDRRFELGYGFVREDVARALGDGERESTGFQGVFRLSGVRPGTHALRIGIARIDGSVLAFVPTQYAISIEA